MKRLIAMGMLCLLLSGCGQTESNRIAIADQYGLAYAPLEIMKQQGLLEKRLGEQYRIEWIKMANTTTIREAMVAGQLDVGFMSIPPFLIAKDNGMPWKIMQGLSVSPLGLVVSDDAVQDLNQLLDAGKIALPQPGSIQHILLSMAAKRTLGNPTAFDHQLIAMKHPDGLQALLAGGEMTAQFTAPPYLQEALDDPSVHQLLSGEEAFGGPFTFIVGVCQEPFYKDRVGYAAFSDALLDAMRFIEEQPGETVAILSKAYGMEPEALQEQLYGQGISFGTEVTGLETFVAFMKEAGYLKPDFMEDKLLWGH